MPKKRERDGIEYWRGKCRELEKEVRQLQKQLKQAERAQHIYDDFKKLDLVETPATVLKFKTCTNCGKGIIKTTDIMGRIFETCDTCDHRKKIK